MQTLLATSSLQKTVRLLTEATDGTYTPAATPGKDLHAELDAAQQQHSGLTLLLSTAEVQIVA